MAEFLRVSYSDLHETLVKALQKLGLPPERAVLSAHLIAQADADGINTHGIARLQRFADTLRAGNIDPLATPTLSTSFGAIERWNGHRGPGNLAAHTCMARAMQLAETHGIGSVALANTTHWQRAGSFGWQAVSAGFASLCWTNTMPNLPPWGAKTPALGNNPLVIAIPRPEGPIVLDMAMSQYSYGTLSAYRQRNEQLPYPGGFDEAGTLTTDPAAIEATQRALPIGLWKGSGLSFTLDILAALLSAGSATCDIPTEAHREAGMSQIFIAFAPAVLATAGPVLAGAIAALQSAEPVVEGGEAARYPGERVLETRAESLFSGVLVPALAWFDARLLAGFDGET